MGNFQLELQKDSKEVETADDEAMKGLDEWKFVGKGKGGFSVRICRECVCG